MPQVIEWRSAGPDDIVYRYPVEQITSGAQLIVHEFESAVFLRDGKAYDVFGPGRHTLTTLNLPIIQKAYGIFFGGKDPFTAIVIYVSTKQFAGKWGAKAQTTELAPLLVHGTAWLRIKDANLFVNEVVGGQGAYTTPQIDDYIRGFINERVIDVMSKYDLTTAFTQLDKASTDVKVNINDALARLGTDLVDFKFEGIDTSDQFRDRLFWIKQHAATSDVLRMETAKDIGQSLSGSSGAGLGSGMVLIPQVMNAPMQQPMYQQPMIQPQSQVAMIACPKCGSQVQQGAKFCPNCGATMAPPAPATTPCPNCGKPVTVGAKFCPECGQKL
jgi:membrane protease subunit (stomatin/prohibitin family)